MPADFVIAATGSRSLATAPAEEQVRVRAALDAEIARCARRYGDALVVMSGMAEGFDETVAVAALDAGVRLWCAIPNRGYGDYYWGRQSRHRRDRRAEFTAIVEQAWRVTHIAEDIHRTRSLRIGGRHMNMVRNDWMVETADAFWIYDTGSRGTADCVASIEAARLPHKRL